jgi:hypothetical protein
MRSASLPSSLVLVAGCAALLAMSGCATPAFNDPARAGPFFVPPNHAGESNLGAIRRVVLLPVWGGAVVSDETAAELDAIFTAALQRENRFEVVSFSRQESRRRFHSEALSAASVLPPELFPLLQREFGADAVMLIDVTTYSAYRPLALGLRAKLASIDGARLVWSFDNEFSANNPAVANSARHHFLGAGSGLPADLTPSVLQSPGRFADYVAAAMFQTLPPLGNNPAVQGVRR